MMFRAISHAEQVDYLQTSEDELLGLGNYYCLRNLPAHGAQL